MSSIPPGPRGTAPTGIRRDHWHGYSLTVALDRAGLLEDIQHHEAEAARLRGLWGSI